MDNKKSDLWGIIDLLKKVIFGAFVVIVIIVVVFVVYLIRSGGSTSTIDATGVYNLVNSENGQVVATDITSEDINKIMELLDGEN